MAEHAGPGTLEGSAGHPGRPSPGASPGGSASVLAAHQSFHGRAASWVAVIIVFIGFVVGGIGLVAGPVWWLFWAGVGISVLGGIVALSTNIMDDWY